MAAGYYPAANLTVVDPDLAAANIALGVQVFGVTGNLAPGTNYQLPATGQTAVYQAGDNRTYQSGGALSFSVFSAHAYIDNNTGLIWNTSSAAIGAASTWAAGVTLCNTPSAWAVPAFADGYSDWRMPNIRELLSIMQFGSVASAAPSWLAWQGNAWSSTTYSLVTTQAYSVFVTSATSVTIENKVNSRFLVAVRGGL